MNAAAHRLELAHTIAKQLSAQNPECEVWLEGPLAIGLAHARSDIDLRLVTPDGTRIEPWSQIAAGVRIDIDVSTKGEIDATRQLFDAMSVTFDDLQTFRTVRACIGAMTRLRTAHRLVDGVWIPVLGQQAVAVYQQWALADRAEYLASLAEDFVGLTAEGMWHNTGVVWTQLQLGVAAADAVSRGHPLLGDKWMPSLLTSGSSAGDPRPGAGPNSQDWSAPLQLQVLEALRRLWPTGPGAQTDARFAQPGAGWMPQRYADGWFVRLGDDRRKLSPTEIESWHAHLCYRLSEENKNARDDTCQ